MSIYDTITETFVEFYYRDLNKAIVFIVDVENPFLTMCDTDIKTVLIISSSDKLCKISFEIAIYDQSRGINKINTDRRCFKEFYPFL